MNHPLALAAPAGQSRLSRRAALGGLAGGALASSFATTTGLGRSALAQDASPIASPAAGAAPVVLVHGAFAGAWAWHRLIPLLDAAGHPTLAPNLPAHGPDRTPIADATLAAYTDAVVAALDAAPAPVILVGHSLGGAVVSQAAEARPDKVQTLVYLCAYLLRDGESLFDLAGTDAASQLGPLLHVDEPTGLAAIDDASGFVDVFFHDCPPDVRALGRSLLAPEPLAPLATPIAVTDPNFGRLPRVYITTTQDRVVSPALQEQMYTATPCDQVLALETGHSPYLAAPAELAALLTGL